MNRISEFIIRLLSPRPGPGEILIMPHLTKDQRGIKKSPRVLPDPFSFQSGGGEVDTPPPQVLPGQIDFLDDD